MTHVCGTRGRWVNKQSLVTPPPANSGIIQPDCMAVFPYGFHSTSANWQMLTSNDNNFDESYVWHLNFTSDMADVISWRLVWLETFRNIHLLSGSCWERWRRNLSHIRPPWRRSHLRKFTAIYCVKKVSEVVVLDSHSAVWLSVPLLTLPTALTHWPHWWNFRWVIFKLILVIDGWGFACEILSWPMWMPVDLSDG